MIELRSQSRRLNEQNVISMIKHYDFYDYFYNKEGKGISHIYKINDEFIFDETIGLMWQRSGSDELIFDETESYIKDLNKSDFAGYDDWRFPTLEEAMSLMEPVKKNDLYINPMFDYVQFWIWTSDEGLYSTRRRWVVDFNQGACGDFDGFDYAGYVRAVRFSQSSRKE